MSKRAVWINPLTTTSTSLDTNINPHDVDNLALSSLLEKQGFEIWLHESFVTKKSLSSWKNKVLPRDLVNFDADIAILNAGYWFIDYINSKYSPQYNDDDYRAIRFRLALQWLKKFKGEIYIFAVDPRKSFLRFFDFDINKDLRVKEIFNHEEIHTLNSIIQNSKIIAADKSIFPERLQHRIIEVPYWTQVSINVIPELTDYKFDTVYVGVAAQTKYRKKLVQNFLDTPNCYTAGNINLRNIESLTNYEKCSLIDTLNFTKESKTSVICGELEHTWLTPRVIQSLCSGTIASIHPEFNGSKYISHEILNDQTFNSISSFDNSLLSKEIYQRQLDFVQDLKNNVGKIYEF